MQGTVVSIGSASMKKKKRNKSKDLCHCGAYGLPGKQAISVVNKYIVLFYQSIYQRSNCCSFLQIKNALQTSSKPLERIGNVITAISLIFPFLYSFPPPSESEMLLFLQEKKKKKNQKTLQITASVRTDLVYYTVQPPSSPAQRISRFRFCNFLVNSKVGRRD